MTRKHSSECSNLIGERGRTPRTLQLFLRMMFYLIRLRRRIALALCYTIYPGGQNRKVQPDNKKQLQLVEVTIEFMITDQLLL